MTSLRCWPLNGPALIGLSLTTAVLGGCRENVEADWIGEVGDALARLSLEQIGSRIEGQACIDGVCERLDYGYLEGDDLELSFGCGRCVLPRTELVLTVSPTEMYGLAILPGCRCDDGEECSCELQAHFQRCGGVCGHVVAP